MIFFACILLPFFIVTNSPSIFDEQQELTPLSHSESNEWTYLIYLCGDNDLDPEAVEDLNEMEKGFVNGAKINILVLWDRYEQPANLYLISNDYDQFHFTTVALNYPTEWKSEPNMGDNTTLQQFIQYAEINYPANHWGFNFWDHGAGQYGVCFDDSTINETDDTSEADGLEIEEILPVFENSGIQKWDLISFDCCLMNLVEWVNEFKEFCDYFVASQESIPGQGFDYVQIVQGLTNGSVLTGLDLGHLIVNSYYSYYTSLSSQVGYNFPTTITLISMAEIQNLTQAFGTFTTGLLNGLTPKSRIELQQLREIALEMDYPFLIDLGHFLTLIQETSSNSTWRNNAKNVLIAYDQMIISFKQTNMNSATGMSIFFPGTYSASMIDYYEQRYDFAFMTNWTSFLKEYHSMAHLGIQWSGLKIIETQSSNGDGNLDSGESGDLMVNFTNIGDLTIINPCFKLYIKNTSLASSNSECMIDGVFSPDLTINLSFSVDLFEIESNTEIVCIVEINFDLVNYTDIDYNTSIFFLSDFNGTYLTGETTLNTAYKFTQNTTFAGMMTNIVSSFIVEVNLAEYNFVLNTLNHFDSSDFDLFLYGETEEGDVELIDSMETFNNPEVLGYDAYSNETVWIQIKSYAGEGLFILEVLSGDGFEFHKEPGSWLGYPIEVSSSTIFTDSINGPGFGGVTYYLISLNAIADMQAVFDLHDSTSETGGMAVFYGYADDFLESESETYPLTLYYQNVGIRKEYVVLVVMPIKGETKYTLNITISKQLIAPIGQISIATIAISILILKLRNRSKKQEQPC
ncbi:hypothetical protein NEF87_002068 [Candidatus Lokiarchaeum ossiferum]|uniref:Uncharacterized protein n=1 Tax=Candidatus Lokiarchaeum ossiferum TaxID=2951803 RepID=A0ABY6HR22_9ARCH|nr:hypothetical protein NEF87_002068 [Candidatus Lokiarchaeum sp. B-35]